MYTPYGSQLFHWEILSSELSQARHFPWGDIGVLEPGIGKFPVWKVWKYISISLLGFLRIRKQGDIPLIGGLSYSCPNFLS
jgi:hypothetical protein